MDDVISLVSSSEEEDGDDTKKLNSKSGAIKKKKIKHNKVLTEISTHKTTPNILKQKRPEPIFPQHNNQNQKVTIIHGLKNKLSINPLAANVVNVVDSHKTGSNVPPSITIIPVSTIIGAAGTGTGHTSHAKLNAPKPMPCTVTPKTNAAPVIPKINSTITISPTKVDAALASSTATPASNTKINVNNSSVQKPIRRVQPRKISDSVTIRASSIEKSSDSDMLSHDSTNDDTVTPNRKKRPPPQSESTEKTVPSKRAAVDKNQNQSVPLNADYKNLIEVCKAADSNADMKKIIDKLVKYYRRSHPEYVNSQDFCKLVRGVTDKIKTQPEHMYIELIDLLEELKTRRAETNGDANANATAVTTAAAAAPPAIDPKVQKKEEKRAKNIERMSYGLQLYQSKIRKLEQAEVDWNAEGHSSYMVTEKLKKKAYKVYMKLCTLTGESQNAERTVKKPIKFDGTEYREFNKRLADFVNENDKFPDMFDVMRILDYCNKKFGYRLDKSHQHSIAQVAFVRIGETLQQRRKRDLYEMVQYHTSNNTDPAREDETLKKKLDANHKHYSKLMDDVIDRYTMRQRSSSNDDEEEDAERPTEKNAGTIASTSNGKMKSTSSKRKSATSPAPVPSTEKSPAPQSQATTTTTTAEPQQTPAPSQSMKMDIALDINDDDDDLMIIPDDDVDLALMGVEEMQELEKDLFPTITSVTSLHPGNNEQFNELFAASPLENGGVL